eukprot:TRINITY_DN18411_c0_g1_i1.p1 TRINITY_DN18411_c0_g1~~TRINITY_DN18411_c0_g1_i1.p1  ORF type:complete len:284 (-),score=72.82 TRINITY_DN18411_c0_g1_i1:69-920(-)
MLSGAQGFSNAGMSRALVCCVFFCSIAVLVYNGADALVFEKDHVLVQRQFWRLFTNQFFVLSPVEILTSLLLLYQFRMFERMMASAKFMVLVMLAYCVGVLTQLASLLLPTSGVVQYGPYPIIFAFGVMYVHTVPVLYRFRLCYVSFSDKWFVYALLLQLLFVSLPGSLLGALAGVVACTLYRSRTLSLGETELPGIALLMRCCAQLSGGGGGGERLQPVVAAAGGGVEPRRANPPAQVEQAIDPRNVEQLRSMGFSEEAARAALRRSNNDLLLATNLLLEPN